MKKTIPLLIFVFLLYAFKGGENNAHYTLAKENNHLVLTISLDAKMMHDVLQKANKCDDQSKLTVCIDEYLKNNVKIMADSAMGKFSFMSSSTVNSNLKMKYRVNRIPLDFEHLVITNTVMNEEIPKFKNVMNVQLGKKPKEYELSSKKSMVELKF
ncbi:MAG: hypothetical protein HKO56_04575 [Bacteroidia bacterium]|nr:hypothetical protein [Bacteroidia bacterium]NNC86063.1 hypothetical protein [Bacteroidia bacterium]NNM15914.1 hypothetical protein [Bacteroidia bacterium]